MTSDEERAGVEMCNVVAASDNNIKDFLSSSCSFYLHNELEDKKSMCESKVEVK